MAEKEQNEIARLFLDVFSSPELHLLSMQADSGDATFVRMTRDTYKRSPFLFKRIVRPDTVSLNVRLDGLLELAAARAPESPSPGYVFHIAYTCSTLIANCLAEAENCLVLKEPYALHQLSRLKYDVRSRGGHDLDRLFGLVISLSSRRFDRSDRVVIKPRSSCNAIMTDLLGARPPARGIFTYCSLPEFLVLVLKDEGRRQAIDMDARARAVESRAFPALSGLDPASLSDAKKGAFIWLLDVYHYLRALETECGPRLRSLEANTFLRAPAESLAAIARHFEVPLTLARAREIVSSSVFSSYSKNTEIKYDRESRAKDLARLAQLHKPEVDEAVEWAAEVTRDAPIPGRLHQPLEVPSK